MPDTKRRVTSWYVILAVLLISTMFETNTSSFVVLIDSIANEMLVFNGGDMTPEQVGLLVSVPSLFMIPGALLSPLVLQKMRMRTFMIIAWALFGLSGMGIFFCETTISVLACRALMGFSVGLCQPSSQALPSRIYDDNWRGRVLGWVGFIGGAVSMLCSLVFGQIAVVDWRFSMFCYPVLATIIIVLSIIFVPNVPVEKGEGKASSGGSKRPLGITVWVLVFTAFVLFVIGAIIQVKTSIIIRQLGLGGPDVAGLVSMSNTFGIVVFGFCFGWFYKWFGRWIYPIGLLITTVGYFWFANSHDVQSLCLSGALASGSAVGIVFVYHIARVAYTAPVERRTTAITMVTVASYIGQFFTPVFMNFVESSFGGVQIIGAQGPEWPASVSLTAAGIVFAVVLVASSVYIFATRKVNFAAVSEDALEGAS